MGLSVTIITKNGSETIRQCLESVKWAEEIIVLDSGSTDNTVEICREYTPHVIETDWPGFAAQKQRALDRATQEWVLSLDEDEWLSPELAAEIQRAIAHAAPDIVVFKLHHHRLFEGALLKSRWAHQYHNDLFRRQKAHYTDHLVHEGVNFEPGRIVRLKNRIYHHSFRDIHELLEKLNTYSSLSAQDKLKRGYTGGVWKGLYSSIWMFFRAYFLQLSFLDGGIGFVFSVNAAEHSFYRYVKMRFRDKS